MSLPAVEHPSPWTTALPSPPGQQHPLTAPPPDSSTTPFPISKWAVRILLECFLVIISNVSKVGCTGKQIGISASSILGSFWQMSKLRMVPASCKSHWSKLNFQNWDDTPTVQSTRAFHQFSRGSRLSIPHSFGVVQFPYYQHIKEAKESLHTTDDQYWNIKAVRKMDGTNTCHWLHKALSQLHL